jgi:hypothetical protein
VRLRVTEAILDVIVLPPASWTVTTGCVAKAVLATGELEGFVVKASLAVDPTVMVKLALVAAVSEPDAAVNV